jgi:hypothetical protein
MPRPRLSSVERRSRANERLVRWRARIPVPGTSYSASSSTLSHPFVYVQPGPVNSTEEDLQRVESSQPGTVFISYIS